MKKTKDKTVVGVVGVLFLIFGIIGTLAVAINGEEYIYWMLFTAPAVILGVIIIAIAMSD